MGALSRIMQDRIREVVKAIISDLNQPGLVQLDVKELARRSMLFMRVPLRHLPLVLKLVGTAYKAGGIKRGS